MCIRDKAVRQVLAAIALRLPPPDRTNAVVIGPSPCQLAGSLPAGDPEQWARVVLGGEPGQGQGSQEEPEVPQGHVVEPWDEQEVHDDADEPRGDDWPAEAWVDGDDHAGDGLDDSDGVHELVWGEGQWVGQHRGQIPVSYTHLRAHETVLDLVCRLLLEKKKKK